MGVAFNQLTFERGNNFGKGVYNFAFILIPTTMVLWKVLGIANIAKKFEKSKEPKKAKKEWGQSLIIYCSLKGDIN